MAVAIMAVPWRSRPSCHRRPTRPHRPIGIRAGRTIRCWRSLPACWSKPRRREGLLPRARRRKRRRPVPRRHRQRRCSCRRRALPASRPRRPVSTGPRPVPASAGRGSRYPTCPPRARVGQRRRLRRASPRKPSGRLRRAGAATVSRHDPKPCRPRRLGRACRPKLGPRRIRPRNRRHEPKRVPPAKVRRQRPGRTGASSRKDLRRPTPLGPSPTARRIRSAPSATSRRCPTSNPARVPVKRMPSPEPRSRRPEVASTRRPPPPVWAQHRHQRARPSTRPRSSSPRPIREGAK